MSDRRHTGEPMGCPNCDHNIEAGQRVVAVTGGTPDEQLGVAHADCPTGRPVCECVIDCRDCSYSGIGWHVHDGERCPVHAGDVLVVG